MRRFRADMDEALAAYERLRRRLEERANRLVLARPGQEDRLLPFGRDQYEAWLDMARAAKQSYQAGELSADEFLGRIDVDGELGALEPVREILPEPDRTPWREYIKWNMDFVPEMLFPDMMYLNMGAEDPAWTTITTQEQIAHAQGGHASLHDRYVACGPSGLKAHKGELDAMFSQNLDPELEPVARALREMIELSMTGELPDQEDL